MLASWYRKMGLHNRN